MSESLQRFISQFAFIFFLALFFYAKVCALIFSKTALPVLVVLLGIGGCLYVLNRKYGFVRQALSRISTAFEHIRPTMAFAFLLTLHLVVRLIAIFVFEIDTTTGYDQQAYIPGTTELLEKGYLEQNAWYLYQAPHFFWFAHVLMLPVSIFGEANIGMLLYLALLSTASSFFLGATLYRQTNRPTAYAFMLLYAVIPSTVISCSHITHEHAFVFFLSLFVWLRWYLMPQACGKPLLRWIAEILAFATLIISAMVNGAGFIALIATIMIYLLPGKPESVFSRTAKVGLLLLLFFGGRYAANSYHLNHSKCNALPDQGEQYKWVLYIGANYETWGHYLAGDRVFFFNSAPKNATREEVSEHHNQLIKDRYKDLLNPPQKLWIHLSHKTMIIWGVFEHPYKNLKELSLRNFFRSPSVQPILKALPYTEAMLALLAALYLIRYGKRPENDLYVWCTLLLCGVTCMLLITEVSGKYTYSVQPFLYIFFLAPCLQEKAPRCESDCRPDL